MSTTTSTILVADEHDATRAFLAENVARHISCFCAQASYVPAGKVAPGAAGLQCRSYTSMLGSPCLSKLSRGTSNIDPASERGRPRSRWM